MQKSGCHGDTLEEMITHVELSHFLDPKNKSHLPLSILIGY